MTRYFFDVVCDGRDYVDWKRTQSHARRPHDRHSSLSYHACG
jgi:hypothetical protein